MNFRSGEGGGFCWVGWVGWVGWVVLGSAG